ncbi:hypothetical protein B484DRAFT_458698 [Ochromonadaceae sp. CCMP2298]|nr:hypothetical protein B484DRAFT_458698 [Ochromonadaceae sp. CCMP2298]|mmetsp:Transcript_31899/g.70279  ORF Transcript_31899/g.70279 Transcript_31899/m.70279 type:complete len:285 (-) Transcript_31899:217-1071(-)
MSESDGLHKLTQYLNQIRRQAEASIDTLNQQIQELRDENSKCKQDCKTAEAQRDHFKGLAAGQTTKQRLQERDDWKSLIDSVQKDRSRLQTQCCELEVELEQSRGEVADLEAELRRLSEERSPGSLSNHPDQLVGTGEELGSGEAEASSGENKESGLSVQVLAASSEDSSVSSLMSPVRTIHGREMSLNFSSPVTVAKQLKVELKRAHSQIELERQQAEAVRLTQKLEILRLKEELQGRSKQIVARVGRTAINKGSAVWNPLNFIGLLFPGDKVPAHSTSILKV